MMGKNGAELKYLVCVTTSSSLTSADRLYSAYPCQTMMGSKSHLDGPYNKIIMFLISREARFVHSNVLMGHHDVVYRAKRSFEFI